MRDKMVKEYYIAWCILHNLLLQKHYKYLLSCFSFISKLRFYGSYFDTQQYIFLTLIWFGEFN